MKICKLFFILIVCLCNLNSKAQIEDTTSSLNCFDCCRPDAYAPFGLMMTDHVHPKGELSFAYYYMNMQMQGNKSGTASISDDEIFKNYAMSPAKMTMQMHMIMAMYGITDKLTVMGMFSYLQNNMTMNMMPMEMMMMQGMNMNSTSNMPTSSKSSGLGDTKIYALYNLLRECNQRLVAGLGLNIPTGSITNKGATMLGDNQLLPYCMQSGSGTFGLLPNVTFVKQHNSSSWGAQAKATINLGTNTQGYSLGNQYAFTSWYAYECLKWMSFSSRLEFNNTGKIYGYNPTTALLMNNDPSANTANYGGQSAMIYAGINIYTPKGRLKGNRLSVEFGVPFYQNLNGVQMSQRGTLYAGWSISL